MTPPIITGLSVQQFHLALQQFFQLLPQFEASGTQLPADLANVDQLKIILDTLPDYPMFDLQPSYVMGLPCRPVVVALRGVLVSSTGDISILASAEIPEFQ